jgi:hypothetical protein
MGQDGFRGWARGGVILAVVASLLFVARAEAAEAGLTVPEVRAVFGQVPEKFRQYEVVLEPDRNEPEWWAGAPSVVRDKAGVFWLACRMRTAEAPRGLRGYEIRLLRSTDGIHFARCRSIRREEVPIAGFERPALLIDPQTGRFKLYACGPWKDRGWCILKFDDANEPAGFEPASARVVIQAAAKSYERDVAVEEYKDPFIIYAEGRYQCYVIGVIRRTERVFHFQSDDGRTWRPAGNPYQPVLNLTGWHNFYVRPACVLPVGVGYLFVYEGSSVSWYDPVYNIATGLGFTFDLHHVTDLTPDSPLLTSATPSAHFHTWRYSQWMYVDGEIWVYAEVARPNETNEIRLFRPRKG